MTDLPFEFVQSLKCLHESLDSLPEWNRSAIAYFQQCCDILWTIAVPHRSFFSQMTARRPTSRSEVKQQISSDGKHPCASVSNVVNDSRIKPCLALCRYLRDKRLFRTFCWCVDLRFEMVIRRKPYKHMPLACRRRIEWQFELPHQFSERSIAFDRVGIDKWSKNAKSPPSVDGSSIQDRPQSSFRSAMECF